MIKNLTSHTSANSKKSLLVLTALVIILVLTSCQNPNTDSSSLPTFSPTGLVSLQPSVATLPPPSQTPETNVSVGPGEISATPQSTSTNEDHGSAVLNDATTTPVDYPKGFWKDLPVIPTEISDRVREIYQTGLEMGNNPRRFTKVGDCNSQHPDFLSGFDHVYYLGEYEYLQPTIDYFKGSFGILSQTTNPGMNTARLLSFLWKTEDCPSSDTLIECQYRVDKPIFAILMLGTNDGYYHQAYPENFERNMRKIIERTIDLGIVPILATKVDDNEGDESINQIIAELAIEYQIPLWNFWKAAQPLANGGLRDHEHLNTGSGPPATDFRMPISLEYGKEMKNLTALQLLNFLMEELADPNLVITPTITSVN